MRLTLPQLDIYFEQLLFPNQPIYNIGAKIEINGSISFENLNAAYCSLIDQHDSFRTIFVKDQDQVVTQIIEKHNTKLEYLDFSNQINPRNQANAYIQEEFIRPFDLLEKKLLHKFILIKIEENFHYLFSVYHHIITDGWGTSLMFQRLVKNYNEICEFGEIITEYPYSYIEFVEDDDKYQNSESFREDLNYWKQKFTILPESLLQKLPSANQINKSERKELIIKRDTYNQLNELALNYKSSTFHLLLGFLYVYFSRKNEIEDLSIGLPVLNRGKSVFKKTVGLFMGVSPLRISLDFESTFEELISLIKNQLRQDYRHQRLPLGKLIQELKLFGEKERLFNITLSYEKQDYSNNFLSTKTRVLPLSHQSERVALAIYIREFDDLEDVKIDFDYNVNYFDDLMMDQLLNHFTNIIDEVLNYPSKKLKDLNYISDEEKNLLLNCFNQTDFEYPKDKTFLDYFYTQYQKTPSKTAIQDDVDCYSYSELNNASDLIAQFIIANFNKENTSPIAVLLNRSATMVVVLLGIFKSGRPYIPLDPSFPADRLNYIIENSKAKLLIYDEEHKSIIEKSITSIALTEILSGENHKIASNKLTVSPQDSAYIIYTSGSTGNPKGVEISHQSLLNFLISISQNPGVSNTDTLFSVTTYSFDISILEFFVPLFCGASVYLATKDVLSNPIQIIKKIEVIKPSVIQATPSFYQMLYDVGWQGDGQIKILCGGDLLSEALAEKLLSNNLEVWNMYGPTETTIWSSVKKIITPKEASNIGKPINNTEFYVLDRYQNIKPIGSPGAIYISGDGLAKGYFNNTSLTKERFINNPFKSNNLIYETGDLGYWTQNGEIIFLGRNDNQVKIRGFRIELGDIESQLNKLDGVKNSVVIPKTNIQQEKFLVAFIIKTDKNLNEIKITEYLKSVVPYYMVPNLIVFLEEFPLTPNQKIDRKSLTLLHLEQKEIKNNFIYPNSVLEKELSKYWEKALNTKNPISMNDNFFSLGGHSLIAFKLVGLIHENLSFEISIKTIFEYPTIRDLSNHLGSLKSIQTKSVLMKKADIKEFYSLSFSQHNIWLASQNSKMSIAYNMSAAFKVKGIIDVGKLKAVINKLIDAHEILRTNFVEKEGVIYQLIKPIDKIQFTINEIKVKDNNTDIIIDEFIHSEFNLQEDLLLKINLLELPSKDFLLIFKTHHTIMDGLSLEFLIKEIINNYNHDLLNTNNKTGLHDFQFKDYSEWFNVQIQNNLEKNELFWKEYLKNYSNKDLFIKDFPLQNNNQNAKDCSFEISVEKTSNIKQFVIEKKTSFYTFLVTTFNVLFSKMSKHDDICFSTINSGRNLFELNNQIGMFVKTLILRTKINQNQAFVDLLNEVNQNLQEICNYQDIPFNRIPQFNFDIMIVYQNPEFSFDNLKEFNGFELINYPISKKYCKTPIVINLMEINQKLKINIEFNSDLFERSTIESFLKDFDFLLSEIIEKPNQKIRLYNGVSSQNSSIDFDFNF